MRYTASVVLGLIFALTGCVVGGHDEALGNEGGAASVGGEGGEGGATGLPETDLAGVYEISDWTRNDAGCDEEGASVLADETRTMLAVYLHSFVGTHLVATPCTDATDCQGDVANNITDYSGYVFEGGNDVDGWEGPGEGVLVDRSRTYLLTSPGEGENPHRVALVRHRRRRRRGRALSGVRSSHRQLRGSARLTARARGSRGAVSGRYAPERFTVPNGGRCGRARRYRGRGPRRSSAGSRARR